MEEIVRQVATSVALALEGIAILLIMFGSAQALVELARSVATRAAGGGARQVFLDLGRWLLLSLEFTLAADVVRTAIAPSWNDIGQLAAIALIRTFLNYFLERDLEKAGATNARIAAAHAGRE